MEENEKRQLTSLKSIENMIEIMENICLRKINEFVEEKKRRDQFLSKERQELFSPKKNRINYLAKRKLEDHFDFSNVSSNNKLPKKAIEKMETWFHLHYGYPYPTEIEILSLASYCRISAKQVKSI